LHGDESPDFCRQLQHAGCTIIKAFSVSSKSDFGQTTAYESFVKYFLFDTKSSERGGTGKRFDWSILEEYIGYTPFVLSGGIGPEHLTDLQTFTHPLMAGVDLNSRFELSPALKDVGKIETFVNQYKKHVY
jgi:phosphoribosylanthranilate isomerase